ncbi:MAG: hypothetical protein CMF12_01240 [Idiomarina sp.]|uniref:hypothetical protein n=1 Tax=Idiomarina sp. TaxID=1874361 RepID=UPI000C3E03A4|nr:hypothetical protein [Idiomarina sp.]MBT41125.1 hypothetical protein [Idiomarina sp.]
MKKITTKILSFLETGIISLVPIGIHTSLILEAYLATLLFTYIMGIGLLVTMYYAKHVEKKSTVELTHKLATDFFFMSVGSAISLYILHPVYVAVACASAAVCLLVIIVNLACDYFSRQVK